jgi:MFS family permease
MIFVAWFFYGAFSQVGMIHIVPYATDLGMAAVAAATLLTIMGIIGTFGRVGLGFMADKFSNKKTIYISFALMAAAFIGLVVSPNLGILYGFAVIFGLLSGCGILLGSTVAEYFGLKGLGSISGALILAYSIGGAVGPFLAGSIFDATGSYQLAFLSCGISGLVSAFIIWLLKPTSRS